MTNEDYTEPTKFLGKTLVYTLVSDLNVIIALKKI